MVATRKLTLNLPSDLIRQVKVHAAEHDTTVNAFIRELLQETLSRQSRARDAAERLLALELSFSADLQSIQRDDIHDRH